MAFTDDIYVTVLDEMAEDAAERIGASFPRKAQFGVSTASARGEDDH